MVQGRTVDLFFFSWGHGGEHDIWRMPPGGGLKQRVTRGGAWVGRESSDGRSLLYQQSVIDDGPLLTVSLSGGTPRQLIACVSAWAFDVAATGIYYVPCIGHGSDPQLHLLDPDSGADRVLGTMEQLPHNLPVTVSRDGQVVLYNRATEASDLMLIENFR